MAGISKAEREKRTREKQEQNNSTEHTEEKKVTHYDKYLVRVSRVSLRRGGKQIGKTTGVKIDELLEENKPQPALIIAKLNASCDWRNASDNGAPMIMQWFPAGEVQSGDSYIAEDLYHEDDDMEIIGFVIHTARPCNIDKQGKATEI